MKAMSIILMAGCLCATLPATAAERRQMTEEQAKELANKLAEQAKAKHQALEGYRNKT